MTNTHMNGSTMTSWETCLRLLTAWSRTSACFAQLAATIGGVAHRLLACGRILLKTKAADAEQYEYRLGERAVTEIGARDIAEFILQVLRTPHRRMSRCIVCTECKRLCS